MKRIFTKFSNTNAVLLNEKTVSINKFDRRRKLLSVNILAVIMLLVFSSGFFSAFAFRSSAVGRLDNPKTLLAYYAFEDANNLGKDYSDNGNHLKLVNTKSTNGAKSSDGVLGNGAKFNGTSVLTASTDKESYDFTDRLTQTTVDFWYKRDDNAKGAQRVISSGQEFENGGFMFASTLSDNTKYLHPAVSNTTTMNPLTGDKISDNWCYSKHSYEYRYNESSWNHITMVVQSGNLDSMTLYINGFAVNTTYYQQGSLNFSNKNIAFTIGGWLKQGLIIEPFLGEIDEVKIYSRALTDKEISDSHNDVVGGDDGFGKQYWNMHELIAHYSFDNAKKLGEDTSGFNNHLFQASKARQGEINQINGEKGKAAYFNGTDFLVAETKEQGDHLYDFSDGLDSATFAYWVKADNPPNLTGAGTIVSTEAEFSYGSGISQYIDYENKSVISKQSLKTSDTYDAYSVINFGNVNYASWYHYAVTFDNSAKLIKLYVNGKLVQTDSFSGVVAIEDYNSVLTVGGEYAESGFGSMFVGALDDMRIYSYPLSANQVKALSQKKEPGKPVGPPKPVNPSKPGKPTNPISPTNPTKPLKPTNPVVPVKPIKPSDPAVEESIFADYPFDLNVVAKVAFRLRAGFVESVDKGSSKGNEDKNPEEFKNIFVATTAGGAVMLATLVIQIVVYTKIGSASKSVKPKWRKGGKP